MMMEKMIYCPAEIEVIRFTAADIVTQNSIDPEEDELPLVPNN